MTDTLGRTAITLQRLDANRESLTVGGVPNPYTITSASGAGSTGIAVPQASYIYATGSTANTIPAIPALSGGISSLGLPDGGSYSFTYDPVFGNINRITYPNGGYVSYTWGFPAGYSDDANYSAPYIACTGPGCASYSPAAYQVYVQYSMPVILSRTVSFDGQKIALKQIFNYQTTFQQGDMVSGWRSKTTTVTTNDLVAGTTSSITYYYTPFQQYSSNLTQRYTGMTAQEYQIVYKDGGGNVVQTVCKGWIDGADLLNTQTTVMPNGMVSEHTFSYGSLEVGYGFHGIAAARGYVLVPNGDDYYDFSAPQSNPTCANPRVSLVEPTPGPLLSSTRQNLTTATTSLYPYGPSIVNIPSSTITKDGSGNIIAETDYQYTDAISQTVSGVVQHDPAFDNSPQVRQNLFSATRQCFPGCASSTTTYSYDNTGQMVSSTDGRGNTTMYSHADAFAANTGQPSGPTDAYLTQVTAPPTSGVAHIQKFTYGFNDGKIRTMTDENSNVTTYCYWTGGCSGSALDPWMRLTQVQHPDGGSQIATYNDAGNSPTVVMTTALNSSTNLVQTSVGDGMGHTIQTQTNSDPAGTTKVDTVYGGGGEIVSSSNPYRSTGESTYGKTTYSYDALGRKIIQTQPDGSSMQWCYNGIASSASQTVCSTNKSSVSNATWVDTADEAGKHLQHVSDGLGRLVAVLEPNPATNTLALETDYGYDALNNLKTVTQIGASGETPRVRGFSYDSLSRLITSTNPETGTICYGLWSGSNCINGYDGNGNLSYKTDARGVTIGYKYDSLNRLLSKTYTNDALGTASSCYQYDTSSVTGAGGNFIGRLTNSWTQKGNCPSSPGTTGVLARRSILSYDAMGRMLSEQQCTRSTCGNTVSYNPSYDYDLAGNIIHHSNGIGTLSFTNCYDAANHLHLVLGVSTPCGSPVNLPSAQLLTSPTYSPAGGLTGALFGTSLQLSRGYDSRLRVSGETDTGSMVPNPIPGSTTITITGLEKTQP